MPKGAAILTSGAFLIRKNILPRLHQYWLTCQWLSLDVVAGAAINCLMVCRLLQVEPLPWLDIGILSGTVFIIYTFDHVMDVWQYAGKVLPARRKFHWRYRNFLTGVCLGLACLLAATVLMFLPWEVIYFGAFLAMFVIVYLWLAWKYGRQHGKKWFHKEMVIALLYTAGIWGVPLCYNPALSLTDIYLAVVFALAALQNLLIFSSYEQEEDLRLGQRSMAVDLGSRQVKRLLIVVFIFSGLILLVSLTSLRSYVEKQIWVTEVLMWAILLLIFAFPGYFFVHRRYRWVGDGVFLLPVWLLV
jgi:hypothetical protein